MKNFRPHIFALIAVSFFVLSAFHIDKKPKKKKELNHYSMKDGEVVPFGEKTEGVIKTISSRGSYDGSRYRWSSDDGVIAIEYVSAAKGMHQSELEISHGVGKIARKGDTSLISCASVYDKFYIFNIADEYAVDSFSKEINVKVVPKSLDGSESSLLVSTHSASFSSIALPKGTKTKEIWKEEHPKETVAEFEYLSIADSEGKQKSYPAGDYVLIGADKLLF